MTVATALFELLQAPPVVAFDRVSVDPAHRLVVPKFAEIVGRALAVIVAVFVQPLLLVYVITLLPAETPVTSPLALTVATAVVADIHALEPAAVAEPVNWAVEPTQTVKVPVMVGRSLTVNVTTLVPVWDPLEMVMLPE